MTTKRYLKDFKQSMNSLKNSGRSATYFSKEYNVSFSTTYK